MSSAATTTETSTAFSALYADPTPAHPGARTHTLLLVRVRQNKAERVYLHKKMRTPPAQSHGVYRGWRLVGVVPRKGGGLIFPELLTWGARHFTGSMMTSKKFVSRVCYT